MCAYFPLVWVGFDWPLGLVVLAYAVVTAGCGCPGCGCFCRRDGVVVSCRVFWAVSRVGGWRMCFPCLPEFILLGGFSGALLLVSILDRVFGCINGSYESYVFFLIWGVNAFRTMGELNCCVKSRELSACPHIAFRGLSRWDASVTLYLWFRF